MTDAIQTQAGSTISAESSSAECANVLAGFRADQLLQELRRRGMVISAWSEEDLDFLYEDDDLAHLSDEQIDAFKPAIFERLQPGLEDALGSRGNEHLADKWGNEGKAIIAALAIPRP